MYPSECQWTPSKPFKGYTSIAPNHRIHVLCLNNWHPSLAQHRQYTFDKVFKMTQRNNGDGLNGTARCPEAMVTCVDEDNRANFLGNNNYWQCKAINLLPPADAAMITSCRFLSNLARSTKLHCNVFKSANLIMNEHTFCFLRIKHRIDSYLWTKQSNNTCVLLVLPASPLMEQIQIINITKVWAYVRCLYVCL